MAKNQSFDQSRMLKLWNQGKSVAEIAKATGASTIWARRVLSTKFPQDYKKGLAARHVDNDVARPANPPPKKRGATGGDSSMSVSDAAQAIAREVCSALYGDVQFTPKPMTRSEAFATVSEGIEKAVKKVGIGFHS